MEVFNFKKYNEDDKISNLLAVTLNIEEKEAKEDFYQILYFEMRKRFDSRIVLYEFEDNFTNTLRTYKHPISVLVEAYKNPLTFDDFIYKHYRSEMNNDTPFQGELKLGFDSNIIPTDQNISESSAFGKWATMIRIATTKVRGFWTSFLDTMQDGFSNIAVDENGEFY